MLLKKSTARNVMVLMVDSADHVTGKASLTLTITASKDGAAFASISPTVTERGDGWYNLALTSSHTDTLGDFAIHITSSGADPTDIAYQVTDGLPGDLLSILGTALTETSAGYLTAGFKKLLDVASPVFTLASAIQTGDSYDRLGTPAGASVSADIADIPTAVENADALLKRDWTSVTGEASRSVLNALRFLRNAWTVVAGTLTVKKEDDTTNAWTGSVSSSSGADPITGVDPS